MEKNYFSEDAVQLRGDAEICDGDEGQLKGDTERWRREETRTCQCEILELLTAEFIPPHPKLHS